MKENVLPFEDLILKKRGGLKTIDTIDGNVEVLRYIIDEVLGLGEDELRALYSTEFNKKYHTAKYISQILKLTDDEVLVGCKHSKNYIISLLFPHAERGDSQKEIIRLLNNNDESTRKHLDKIKDLRKKDTIIFRYMEWIFDEVMEMETQEERFEFLSKAEILKFAEKIPCFLSTRKRYYCLLDFYFHNLPIRVRQSLFPVYMKYRETIPEGLDVIRFALSQ